MSDSGSGSLRSAAVISASRVRVPASRLTALCRSVGPLVGLEGVSVRLVQGAEHVGGGVVFERVRCHHATPPISSMATRSA